MEKYSYVQRLRLCYKNLANSRVVKNHETDDDALQYFEQHCNLALPCDGYEHELKDVVRSMHSANPTQFNMCITNAPYLILLTNPRSIVIHFGVLNLIYISWKKGEGSEFEVKQNTRLPNPFKGGKKRKLAFKPKVPPEPQEGEIVVSSGEEKN